MIEALECRANQPTRSDAEAEEARTYIDALRTLGAREAVPTLIRIAREAIGLRSTAVRALNDLDPVQAAADLVDLLQDPGDRLLTQVR